MGWSLCATLVADSHPQCTRNSLDRSIILPAVVGSSPVELGLDWMASSPAQQAHLLNPFFFTTVLTDEKTANACVHPDTFNKSTSA